MQEIQTPNPTIHERYAHELAPLVATDSMPPFDQFLHVNTLGRYLEDAGTAAFLQQRQYGAPAGSSHTDYEHEETLYNATLDSLDTLARYGKTFLTRELARGMSESPLAVLFDHRPDRRPAVNPKELRDYYLSLRMGKHPVIATEEQVFSDLMQRIHDSKGVDVEKMRTDAAYTAYRQDRNIYNAEGRLWQLAYEMPSEQTEALLQRHSFRMRAFGEITSSAVDPAFYEHFVNQKPVDYTAIRKAGLQYAAVRIAPDTIGFFEETGRLVELFDVADNTKVAEKFDLDRAIAETLPGNSFDEREKVAIVFRQLSGNLQTRFIIENATGLSLDSYSIRDQILIDSLLVRATSEQMQGIIAAGAEHVLKVARALEFGSNFGDSILNIAEKAEPHVAGEVFAMVGRYRKSAAEFGSMFAAHDPDFAAATIKALNESLTDGIVAIEELVTKGKISDIDLGAGGQYSADLAKGLEAMRLADKSLQIIHAIFADEHTRVTRVTMPNEQFSMYRFSSKLSGDVILYIRPEGAKSYDPHYEYGNSRGVEASISFIVNPLDPHHLRADKDADGVSFRFDREGRVIGESPFSEDRDPTREDGLISIDVSSILGKADSPAVAIGSLFAAGNKLRIARTGAPESLHHNTNYFDQRKYGSSTGFKGLAEHTIAMAEALRRSQHSRSVARISARQAVRAPGQTLAA